MACFLDLRPRSSRNTDRFLVHMIPLTNDKIDLILAFLDNERVSVGSFLTTLINSVEANHIATLAAGFPSADQRVFIRAWAKNPSTSTTFDEEIHRQATIGYLREMVDVQDKAAGFHYNASSMTAERLEAFEAKEMGKKLEGMAPSLWQLFGGLLDARHQLSLERRRCDGDGDTDMISSQTGRSVDSGESEDEEETAVPARESDTAIDGEEVAFMHPEDPEWIHEPEGGDTSSDNESADDNDQETRKILTRGKRMTKKAIRKREALLLIVSLPF